MYLLRAASIPRLLMYASKCPTQLIYALLLYYYKKKFGEALGTLRSVFLSTVPSILRLVMRAQGDSNKCKSIAIFLL
jgi:hypothetical protein